LLLLRGELLGRRPLKENVSGEWNFPIVTTLGCTEMSAVGLADLVYCQASEELDEIVGAAEALILNHDREEIAPGRLKDVLRSNDGEYLHLKSKADDLKEVFFVAPNELRGSFL
jgi:hypothetical protein